jgi:uncharacterized membrane protein
MSKNDNSKWYAFLGVFLLIIGFIIVYATKKNDKYAMYYAKQGLILSIIGVIAALVNVIPGIGQIIFAITAILLFVAWIIGLIYALSGEEKPIPVVGAYIKFVKL